MSLFLLPGRPSSGHLLPSWWGLPAILLPLLSACAGAPPASPGAPPALRNGLTLEREIRGGESHAYPVQLRAGQFLRVVADQNGVDVVVRLVDPGGAGSLSVDSLTGTLGEEDCAVVAERTGLYRIEVSASPQAGGGGYGLRVEGPRSPSRRDRLRAEAVRAMAEAFAAQEGPEQRLVRYEKALALWERLGERRRQAEMLFQTAKTLEALGQLERAAKSYSQAAGLWGQLGDREMGDLLFRGVALVGAGPLYQQLAQWTAAQEQFEEALKVSVETEDLEQQSKVLHHLGVLARQRGDARRGIELLLRAIRLARQIGDKKLEAKALNNLGVVFMDISDRQQARRFYKEALDLCREIEDRETEGSVLNNLGDAYQSLGDWEAALEFHNESLRLHRDLANVDPKHQNNVAIALNNIGMVHQRLGQTGKTLELLKEALSLVQETDDKARFLTNLGFVHLLRGEADKAREASLQALALVEDRGDVEAAARHALGSADRLLGDYEAAREQLARALALSQEWRNQSREADVKLTLARLERDRGNLAAALALVEESVGIVESLRAGVASQSLRASFLASKQAHYDFQIDLLMALHASQPEGRHAAEALRVSEEARARILLEILQEGGADIRQEAPPDLLARERLLRAEVNERELQRLKLRSVDRSATPARLAEAERRLDESLDAYRDIQEKLLESNPRYAALAQPPRLEIAEIQTRVLDGGALLLEYFLGTERSYLWAVTPESIESFTLPSRNRIEELARRCYGLLTARPGNRPGPPGEAEKAAAELSEVVLGPVRHLLTGQPLLVVPDGALHYIPFSALPIPSTTTHLIQQHPLVVNLPSASALAVLRAEVRDRPTAPLTLAVLADPVFQQDDRRLVQLRQSDAEVANGSSTHRSAAPELGQERESDADLGSFWRLRHSRKEALAIADLLPADQTFTALDFDASRATALSGRLAEYRNVHFATHGLVRSDHPELSSLVLSFFDVNGEPVDGFLRLNDIYNLELRADLVVLSACRTALGKEIRGEGLVGLTRGFMYAGAPRVLATLWSVDDSATADFMKHFYRAMLTGRLSPAEALREAQLAMIAKPNRKAPFFWAGFTLQGEWK